ncbi:hypothetical protein CCACVL1_05090 [Corchorus capsularis]|uniref:Uncharacterized protein n=1 Tax=Corchorus capsularis TaxID=210143 RepID=A0A1R3JMG4_COCAP|nr:hypothetical protein CCACVL1_05090 [Corchorus capsularis]
MGIEKTEESTLVTGRGSTFLSGNGYRAWNMFFRQRLLAKENKGVYLGSRNRGV